MLECVARAPGWRDGMNFLHGTGHGIGAYLNVHEGPAGIGGGATDIGQVSEARRRMYLYPIEAGHYLSDEPGFYLEGKFGIRIEAGCRRGSGPRLGCPSLSTGWAELGGPHRRRAAYPLRLGRAMPPPTPTPPHTQAAVASRWA